MNKGCIIIVAILTSIVAPGFIRATDFSRYQSIIDRKPFGAAALEQSSQVNNPAVAPADLFTKTLKMVAIKLEKNGQTRVGFINQAAGNKSYYMLIGETSPDGIEVVDADFLKESALLRKESQSGWIYMKTSTANPLQVSGKASKGRSSLARTSGAIAENVYTERVRKRLENKQKEIDRQMAETPKMTSEELEKHLNDYQMDVIRKGMPPLPVPLTKEMDDQLVSEGVLPPLDVAPTVEQ